MNQFWAEVFGEVPSRLEGTIHQMEDIFPEEKKSGESCWVRPLFSRKNQSQRKMAFTQQSIPLEQEIEPGTLIHMDDQTEVIEAREKMRVQQARLTAAIEGAEIGLWEWDVEEGVFKQEPSWFHVLGYREDEFNSSEDPWEKIIHPEDRSKILNFYQERLAARANSFETEYRLRHKNGEFIWVAARGIVMERNNLGEPIKVVGIIFNISQMKYVELELRKAMESAESASEAKSYFLANITHEIRTPLNAILGMASILKDTDLDEEQIDSVRTIIQSSENLTSLISEVLDFSKIESGNFDLDIQEFPLRICCEDAANLFKNRLKDHNLEFSFDLDPGVDQYYLGDPQRLRQILLNLVGNAIKFTTRGRIDLRIQPAPLDDLPENGQEAFDVLRKKDFDLVFMDIRMPVMDGLEAARMVRKQLPRDRQPRIVALTAHVVQGEKEKCLLSGMDGFVPKPITPEKLKETVQAYSVAGRNS